MFNKKRHHFLIISMVSPWLVSSAIIVSLAALPSHSLPSGLGPATPPAAAAAAIPSSPALSSDPLVPPFQELSPDIAPLLPSPGGAAPASGGSSSMPTIPSTPSPPNPDEDPLGLDSAVAPESSFMASFAITAKPIEAMNVVALSIWAALWAMQLLKM
ncbi:classical arabinogalactan protein 26-like [Syzygium oleosum]|uniref:classical arabinogalactan protein 26-like n=1 Tax=Syzygium oleosum TaxID=219896 RepID=UPI0024BA1DF7|nr:classical arabinogalactan protein 26-like [Syzygium oleosum]